MMSRPGRASRIVRDLNRTRSVRYVHTILRKALQDAVRWSALARNPADAADPPAIQRGGSAVQTWSGTQLKRFLDSVSEDRLVAAWTLAATTGMRRGEVLGLRWRDVDLEMGRLSIQQTIISVGYEVSVSTPKTAKGRRSLALDRETVRVFRAHRSQQLQGRLASGSRVDEMGLVFCGTTGLPIHPDGFGKRFKALQDFAALPRIRFHDLRHTHATLALQAGVHPRVVFERLGHSTVAITLDTYSHVIPAMQEEAAELVASLIFRPT